jgi:two-component system OmpR family response regulator
MRAEAGSAYLREGLPPVTRTLQVLWVEEDAQLTRLTAEYLQDYGLCITRVPDSNAALREALRQRWDAVLMEVGLPGLGGLELIQRLRAIADIPLLIVSGRTDVADRVLGLEQGADDYILKPFAPRELLARIHAAVRRTRGTASTARPRVVGGLVVDPSSRKVTFHGRTLPVTSYEFSLLQVMAESPGRVFTREQLLELAKGNSEEAFDRSIDVHVFRLRQKLGEDPRRPRLLKTVRGVGYTLMGEMDA